MSDTSDNSNEHLTADTPENLETPESTTDDGLIYHPNAIIPAEDDNKPTIFHPTRALPAIGAMAAMVWAGKVAADAIIEWRNDRAEKPPLIRIPLPKRPSLKRLQLRPRKSKALQEVPEDTNPAEANGTHHDLEKAKRRLSIQSRYAEWSMTIEDDSD